MKSIFLGICLLLAVGVRAQTAAPANGPAKAEEEPKIAGQTIPRDSGGYLGLQLVNNTFKLSFYNEKKKPVPADRAMGTARWLVKYNRAGEERAVLNLSADGLSLVADKNVRAPYSFKLYLSLYAEATPEAQAVENFILDFSG